MTMLEKLEAARVYQKYKDDILGKLLEIIKDKYCRQCSVIDSIWVGYRNVRVTYGWYYCGVYTLDTVYIPIALLVEIGRW